MGAHETVVRLLAAAAHAEQQLGRVLEPHGITHEQYNVLRILRQAGDHGLPRSDVAEQLLNRAPDVTRLLDRLERRELIERVRGIEDRRQSLSRLTSAGQMLLGAADAAVEQTTRDLTASLGVTGRRELSRLLGVLVPSS